MVHKIQINSIETETNSFDALFIQNEYRTFIFVCFMIAIHTYFQNKHDKVSRANIGYAS